jgi:hypothetical protein
MAKRKYICNGYPTVKVASFNKVYSHGDTFTLNDEDLTVEFKKKLKMGLFKQISKSAGAILASKKKSEGSSKLRPVHNSPPVETLQKVVTDSVQKELLGVETRIEAMLKKHLSNVSNSSNTGGSGILSNNTAKKPPKKKWKPKEESLAFIRPDVEEITGDLNVEGAVSTDTGVSNAVEKLKKKGKRSKK